MHKLGRSLVILLALGVGEACFAQQMFTGLDAKSLGYGGSGAIGIRDPSALAWNPAAIGFVRETDVFFSFRRPFQISQVAAAGFIPFWGSFAANLQQTLTGQSVAVGWAFDWPSRLITGASLQNKLDDHDRSTTLSVGLLYHPASGGKAGSATARRMQNLLHGLTVTAAIQNIPLDDSTPIPIIRLAGSYALPQLNALVMYGYHFDEHHKQHQLAFSIKANAFMEIFAGMRDFDKEELAAGVSFTWHTLHLNASYHPNSQEVLFSTSFRLGASGEELSKQAQIRAQTLFQSGDKRFAYHYAKLALAYDGENERAASLLQGLDPNLKGGDVAIDSLLKAADGFVSKRWYLSAAVHYLRVLKLDAENKRAKAALLMIMPQVDRHIEKWFQLGQQYVAQNEPAIAHEVFEAILLVRPDHEPSRQARDEIDRVVRKKAEEFYFQGLGYYSQRNWQDAEQAFKEALALRPDWREPQSYLRQVREQLEQNSRQVSQLLARAGRYERNGEWINARRYYREALSHDPKNSVALTKLEELQTRLNSHLNQQYLRAEAAFNNRDPETARRLLAEILDVNPGHAASRRLLETVNNSLPPSLQAILRRAQGYADRNEHVRCITVLDSLLAMQPQVSEAQQLRRRSIAALDVNSLIEVARDRYLHNRYSEAMVLLEEALKKEPGQEQAAVLLEQTLKRIDSQVDESFNRGIKLYTEEKYRQAIAEFDKVLAINPEHQGAREYRRQAQERMDVLNKMP